MPSILSPISPPPSKAYAPLADEVNPPFGNIAPSPAATRNGTIVYGKRLASSSTISSSSGSDEADRDRSVVLGSDPLSQPSPPSIVMRGLRSESEETLNAENHNGNGVAYPGELDIGEIRREEALAYGVKEGKVDYKGKGRQEPKRAWDVEQGRVEEVYGVAGEYPPTNEEEEEERRVQENLARMAARDQARRRAARLSRQVAQSPSLSSIDGSPVQRPLSVISSSASKRSSLKGLIGNLWAPSSTTERIEEDGEGQVPLQLTTKSASTTNNPYANPYDPPASIPKMIISPASYSPTRERNPFTDPPPGPPTTISPDAKPPTNGYFYSDRSARRSTSSDVTSPTEGFTYGYAGPGWRGGAGAQRVAGGQEQQGGEKWWHALCAWGRDLDGGEDDPDGQAGRTNPFE